jgi:hypothetical protein
MLAGVVQKLIERSIVNGPRQAQTFLTGTDHLSDEVHVPNVHEWEVGEHIEATIRTRPEAGIVPNTTSSAAKRSTDVCDALCHYQPSEE